VVTRMLQLRVRILGLHNLANGHINAAWLNEYGIGLVIVIIIVIVIRKV
jgi:hypothetical protein